MLNIFVGIDNKPTENYIHDAESLIPLIGVADTSINRAILKSIEHGEYLCRDSFIDRVGNKVSVLNLSSGSKALISIQNTDKVINGVEMGLNAFEFLILYIDGSVYFKSAERFEMPDNYDVHRILINGNAFDSEMELEDALWKEKFHL